MTDRNNNSNTKNVHQKLDGLGTRNSVDPLDFASRHATESGYTPFSWLIDSQSENPAGQFFALTKDVAQGVQTCLELVYSSVLDRQININTPINGDSLPVLNIADTESLLRLAIASASMLANAAGDRVDGVNTLIGGVRQ